MNAEWWWLAVAVKWSACSTSNPTICVRITLESSDKIALKSQNQRKRGRGWSIVIKQPKLIFLKIWTKPGLFLFIFVLFHNAKTNVTQI